MDAKRRADAQLQLVDELLYTWSALIFSYDRFGDTSFIQEFEDYLKSVRKDLAQKAK